jgi:hypothetical protein
MSIVDEDDAYTRRFFGVDGRLESAAVAGVEAITDKTNSSATIARPIKDRFRRPRSSCMARQRYSRPDVRASSSLGGHPTFAEPHRCVHRPPSGERCGSGTSASDQRVRVRVALGKRTMNSVRGPIQGRGTRLVVTTGSPDTATPLAKAVSRARRIAYSSETPRSLRFTRNSYCPTTRTYRAPRESPSPLVDRRPTDGQPLDVDRATDAYARWR